MAKHYSRAQFQIDGSSGHLVTAPYTGIQDTPITKEQVLSLFQQLKKNITKEQNNEDLVELAFEAIDKMTDWIDGLTYEYTGQGANNTTHGVTFIYKKKEYRIDWELNGKMKPN